MKYIYIIRATKINSFKTTLSYLYPPNKNSSVQEGISGEAIACSYQAIMLIFTYIINLIVSQKQLAKAEKDNGVLYHTIQFPP